MKNTSFIVAIISLLVNRIILIHTYFIIYCAYKNPLTALKVFKAMRKTGKLFHGHHKIIKSRWINNRLFWSSDIPGWGSRAYRTFILNRCTKHIPLSIRQNTLQTVIFAITNKCPLACEHCFEWNNIDSSETLSNEDLRMILKSIQNTHVSSIQFSGGEPLSRYSDLTHLLQMLKSETDSWLLTSGFGLSKTKANHLKKVGLTGAYISLDHWREEKHNQFRNNKKSFYWVKQAASNCKEAGIIVGLSLCATKEFVSKENLYSYLILAKQLGATFIRILEARKVGKYTNKDVEPDKNQISELNDFYTTVNFTQEWLDYPIIIYPGFYQNRIGCFGAGKSYIYVDSHGDVHACPFCQNSVGNILNKPISTMIQQLQTTGCHKYKLSEV